MLLSDICLTSVCLASDVCLSVAYIGPNSRTVRPRKIKIGTAVALVTRDSDTMHFQGQKIKVQLVAEVLDSQHAGKGATSRINTKILSTCSGGILCRHAHSLFVILCTFSLSSAFLCKYISILRCILER